MLSVHPSHLCVRVVMKLRRGSRSLLVEDLGLKPSQICKPLFWMPTLSNTQFSWSLEANTECLPQPQSKGSGYLPLSFGSRNLIFSWVAVLLCPQLYGADPPPKAKAMAMVVIKRQSCEPSRFMRASPGTLAETIQKEKLFSHWGCCAIKTEG